MQLIYRADRYEFSPHPQPESHERAANWRYQVFTQPIGISNSRIPQPVIPRAVNWRYQILNID